MRILVGNVDDQRAANPSLLRIIVCARDIQARVIQQPSVFPRLLIEWVNSESWSIRLIAIAT
jgi:hypothetical protein